MCRNCRHIESSSLFLLLNGMCRIINQTHKTSFESNDKKAETQYTAAHKPPAGIVYYSVLLTGMPVSTAVLPFFGRESR